MKLRSSLSARILLLAFLNVVLLAVVFFAFARIQFRFDLGSFLLAPARDRIISVSRLVALQLPDTPRANWNQLLKQYASTYPAEFYLFRNDGSELAGQPVNPPREVVDSFLDDRHAQDRTRDGRSRGFSRHQGPPRPGPPLFFAKSLNPPQYWVAVHIPIFGPPGPEPMFGALVWRFTSLWTNTFFFDYKPWIAVILAVILVCVACWLPLIRGLTRAISGLSRATGQIAEGNFDIQLPANRRDELGQLSESINRMAHRLAGFVHGQKRFLGDIAHELCSPIARIQMALGILDQRAEKTQKQYVADLQEEIQHMSALVNELLSFSKAQINATTDLEKVNVANTVRQVIQREGAGQTKVETYIDHGLEVMAQPDYLYRSLANVLRNAIRYAGDAGPITVTAENGNDSVAIIIADQGPGIPEAELEEVFKPFYRPEFARQRETGGVGLGLAIVKTCLDACNGSVICRNRVPHGFEVEIRLKAACN